MKKAAFSLPAEDDPDGTKKLLTYIGETKGKDGSKYCAKHLGKFEDNELETIADLSLLISRIELWKSLNIPLGLKAQIEELISKAGTWESMMPLIHEGFIQMTNVETMPLKDELMNIWSLMGERYEMWDMFTPQRMAKKQFLKVVIQIAKLYGNAPYASEVKFAPRLQAFWSLAGKGDSSYISVDEFQMIVQVVEAAADSKKVSKKSPLHSQDHDLIKLLSKHIPSALGAIVAEYLRYRPIFVIGGREIPCLAMLYSPSTNTWAKMPDTKYKHYFAAAVNFKNRIMVISGNDESCFSHTNVEMYDPDLEQWVDVAPLNQDRSVPTACVCNDKVYVMGGQSSSCARTLDTVERYDEKENKWETVAPMSRTRLRAVSFSLNGKVYVCGGSPDISNRHTNCHNDCEMYDPETEAWTKMADMPISVTYASATVRKGKAYIAGGSSLNDGDVPLSDMLCYDPDKDEWSRMPSMQEGRSYIPALVNTDEGLLVIGGWQSHEADGCVIERYDAEKRTWVRTTHAGEQYAECPDVKFGICAVAMSY